MNNILFSVLVSFYKDTKDLIKETLDSLANQINFDLNKLEVVVIDDGSGLDISPLINSYKNKIKNINYVVKEHGDRASVYEFAKANKLLHGEYFSILDSDDKWHEEMLCTIQSYLTDKPDVISTNLYRWYPTKNKSIGTPVILIPRTKLFNLNISKKQLHLLKTPYSWPIGKFFKTEMFYNINFETNYVNDKDANTNDILFHICPDVVLYFMMLENTRSFLHICRNLSFARQDRVDSFSNRSWDLSKIRTWTKTINFLTSINAPCNGFYYLIFKHFYKAYERSMSSGHFDKIKMRKKLKISYIPKILHPICKLFFKIKIKKISKKIPIEFI